MAGVENLMLENVRAIRGDVSGIKDDLRGMRAEMTAMRQHMAGVVTLQEHDRGNIASLKSSC